MKLLQQAVGYGIAGFNHFIRIRDEIDKPGSGALVRNVLQIRSHPDSPSNGMAGKTHGVEDLLALFRIFQGGPQLRRVS